jgi:hypothetical protein
MIFSRFFKTSHLDGCIPHDGGVGTPCPKDEVYLVPCGPGVYKIIDKREEIRKAPPTIASKIRETISRASIRLPGGVRVVLFSWGNR